MPRALIFAPPYQILACEAAIVNTRFTGVAVGLILLSRFNKSMTYYGFFLSCELQINYLRVVNSQVLATAITNKTTRFLPKRMIRRDFRPTESVDRSSTAKAKEVKMLRAMRRLDDPESKVNSDNPSKEPL